VEDVRPRGPVFQFRARLQGLTLLGRSEAPLEAGARVGLAVRGPVVVVAAQEDVAP
jgi:hypothetical protein